MEFTKTAVDGCWIIDIKPFEDARGGFARTFCCLLYTSRCV